MNCSFFHHILDDYYSIPSVEAWMNFKKYNLDYIYHYASTGWQQPLINDRMINFFHKFKKSRMLFRNFAKLLFLASRKPIIPSCEYVVTTHCNLSCKYCNTFIPYFKKNQHFSITFEKFKYDIDKLTKSSYFILHFGFVGGEPLLNKELPSMIDYVCDNKKIRNIFLVTNCTVMPDSSLIKSMRKNKQLTVRLSDYTHAIDNSKYEQIKKILIENNIRVSCPHHKHDAFLSTPNLYVDKFDYNKIVNQYYNCWGRTCNMLCDGIFCQCTTSVYILRNMTLTDGVKNEIFDIRALDNDELTKRLIRFYCRPYSEFCNYCHMENVTPGHLTGEQTAQL